MGVISHREMRNDSALVLRRVQAGETLTITNRGMPVARLTPVRQSVVDELSQSGMLRDPVETWDTFAPPRRPSRLSSAEIIADDRGPDAPA